MAIIGKIRKQQGLILLLLGLALAAFVVMGMNSQFSSGSGQATSIGSINGENIDYTEFDAASNALGSTGDEYSKRNSIWNYFVENSIVKGLASEMGLGVDEDEMEELEFGQNVSPIIQQRFSNPQTRQVDRAQLNQIKSAIESGNLNPKYKAYWKHQRNEITKDRLQSKISNLVTKSMIYPDFMNKEADLEANTKVSFNYVKLPFTNVKDSEVNVSDEDLSAYLKDHNADYVKDKELRVIKYATFNVIPTKGDSIIIRDEVAELKERLKTSDNDSLFVDITSGAEMSPVYLKKDQLTTMGDVIFGLNKGDVYGPYKDGKNYKCLKVVDRMMVPDSVKSRHILIPAKDQASYKMALDTLNSIKTRIENGEATFADMAAKYGNDGTKTKGGDLGYAAQGGMVKPFNDLIFFDAKQGDLNIIGTQFGLHLVEVTGRKFINNDEGVKLITVSRAIVPSEDTQNAMMSEVNILLEENNGSFEALNKAISGKGVVFEESNPVGPSDYLINGLESGEVTRNMVKWAYTANQNDVSPTVYNFDDKVDYYTSKLVLASLGYIQPAGTVNVDVNRKAITPLVLNIKKGEKLAAMMKGDLASIAAQNNTSVDTVTAISFNAASIPVIGNEPKVFSSAFGTALGASSEPIIGETGVYKIKVTSKPEAVVTQVNNQFAGFRVQTMRSRVNAYLMRDLKKSSEVKDMRSKVY